MEYKDFAKHKQYFCLPEFYRMHLSLFEKEKQECALDEESFVGNILSNNGISLMYGPKKTNSNDNGVDFVIRFFGKRIIFQLKWWKKTIHAKSVKQIFGELFWNQYATDYPIKEHKDEKLYYVLFVPFIGQNVNDYLPLFKEKNYIIVSEQQFVQFLLNPSYFLESNFN